MLNKNNTSRNMLLLSKKQVKCIRISCICILKYVEAYKEFDSGFQWLSMYFWK